MEARGLCGGSSRNGAKDFFHHSPTQESDYSSLVSVPYDLRTDTMRIGVQAPFGTVTAFQVMMNARLRSSSLISLL